MTGKPIVNTTERCYINFADTVVGWTLPLPQSRPRCDALCLVCIAVVSA